MSADLGPISMSLDVNTRDFDSKLDASIRKVQGFQKATERADVKLDVTPTGARELDSASKSATELGRNLDRAGQSAGKVKAPTGMSPVLDSSSSSAGQLAEELNRAGGEAQQLGSSSAGLTNFDGALAGLATTARNLLPALSGAAAAGAALTKGWDRLTSIDNAQFKLQGLGHTAESTADIMNSAMDAVTGTAYGFGDAASLAAGVVAATGAQGEELTQILTTVADTAAISGRSLGDMGMIFNSVASSGIIQGQELNQLMDSGIPILQMLGDELGVTAGEVRKMASDGEISFAQFEAAMRSGMGGAAQEMGQSVTGAIANVGAALGRLGAEILTPLFSGLPDMIGGVTSGIDFMTDSVSSVVDAWDSLPAPVKAAVGGMVAAKGATMLLNTELGGKLLGHLLDMRDHIRSGVGNVRDFGSSLSEAYRYTRQANPEMGRLGASFQVVAGQGGVAAGAMGRMRGAASGLLTALGGPWGLAIGGATAAVGLFIQHVQKAREEQQAAEEATEGWADALTQADGQITDSLQNHALLAVEQAEVADQMDRLGVSSADAAAAVLDLDGTYESMISSLDRIIEQGTEMEGDARIGQRLVRTEDAEAAIELRTALEELHGQQEEGARRAEDAALAQGELSKQVSEAARQSERSVGPHDVLNEMLSVMGEEAKDADDAIGNLATSMLALSDDPALRLQSYLADSASAIQSLKEELADGFGGLDVETGMFDEWDEQGRKLSGTMDEIRDSLFGVAAAQYQTSIEMGESGVEAAESAAEAAREHSDALREQMEAAGLTEEQIEALFDRYSLFPDDIMTHVHLAGSETAMGIMDQIDERLANVNAEDHTITIDSSAIDMTAEQASELGLKLEKDLDSGIVVLSAETELAEAAIEEIAAQTAEVTQDNNIVFRADTIELTEQINDLEGAKAELVTPAEFPIFADTAEARAAIDEMNLEVSMLPDGSIYVHDNTPEVMQGLRNAGAETTGLPQGNIIVTDTTGQNIAALQDLGARTLTLPDGSVVITENSADVKEKIERNLAEGVLNRTGRVVMDVIENVTSVFRSEGGSIPERAKGGSIPRLAAGDRTHGGYQLPTSGPGTQVTDGILGLDAAGVPTAWVDRGEYVTNRASTAMYLGALEALNQDDPAAAIRALIGVQRLADGGAVDGERSREVSAATSEGAPGTSTGVLDHAALLGDLVDGIPGEKQTTVTLTAEGVADELARIGQQLEPLGEGETVTVDAVGDQALSVLNAVGVETTALPDGSVEVTATTGDTLDQLAGVSNMLFEVGDTVVEPIALLDATELEVSARDAEMILDALDIENPTPYASLIIDDLLNGKGIAQGELEFLASMVPTPAADLNTALFEAGVSVSESELQRVGNSKATSVVDVNNTSALANVNATLDALNQMPVERVIRIVAAGSAAGTIGSYNRGGRIPALASGGRLPTTGPGTGTVDGILGVGDDGIPTARVDAGEWVITRNRSEQFHNTLNAINSGKQQDILTALQRDMGGLQALAGGGVVSPDQLLDFAAGQNVNGQQAARSLQGAPYVWGGVNWGDCSGAMAGLANFAVGMAPFASRFATGNQREALAAMGFRPGLGDPATSFNLGWFNGGPWGGHTSGDINGTAVEMGGGAGGQGKIGGAAASASSGQYTDHAHLTLGELWAFDYFQDLPRVTARYQPAPDPMWETEGGQGVSPGGLGLQIATGLGGGVSHTGGDGVHLNNGMVIPYKTGRLYDTGGDWPTDTWGFNATGGTEHVLTPPARETYIDIGRELPRATDAMHRVADAVGGLHPELRRMVDDITPHVEGAASQLDVAISQLERIADAESVEGMTARATANRVFDLGILPYSTEMQSILNAEQELLDMRAETAARAQAITEAERSLLRAREDLAELQATDPGMSVQDARKLADAEDAVAKARADGDAEKVADAEQKLARTREDVAASADQDALKRQEDIAKATEGVADAENDLAAARRDQVKSLDHIVLPDTVGGWLPQITQASNALSGALPQVATALSSIAGIALPAGITLGNVFSIAQMVISVATTISGIIKDIREAAVNARVSVAEAQAQSMGSIAEWTKLVHEQRQAVSRLRLGVMQAQMEMVSAQWEVRTAQLDVGRAQLEGVRSVAEAEAALQEERERQARANWWATNDLSLAYDRLRWAQRDVAYGQLEDYVNVTPEILALQHEVLVAQLTGASSVYAAQLASLQASQGLMEAQKLLSRGQRDLNLAMQEYNRQAGLSFGMTTPQAMIAEEVARLQAENARLAGESGKASGPLSFLDLDGDGRILFGLIDLAGRDRDAFSSAIEANNKAIERLLQSGYAPDWDPSEWDDALAVIDQAADLYRRGNEAAADALIAGSIWGDAERALNENRVLDEIARWEQSQRDLEDSIEDLEDRIDFEEMAQPMRELIAALQAGANSAQYSADALRESNPAVREALERLAEFEGGAARDIAAGRPVRNVTIIGDNFSADQLQELLDQLADSDEELNIRIGQLEQPDRPTGRDVMSARRRRGGRRG